MSLCPDPTGEYCCMEFRACIEDDIIITGRHEGLLEYRIVVANTPITIPGQKHPHIVKEIIISCCPFCGKGLITNE
jgi:hypothetical protein